MSSLKNKSEMKVSVYNIKGEATGRSIELPEEVFGIEPHEHSVWLDVKRFLAAQRQGTDVTDGCSDTVN
jgi:large subunit ribosomal protein L4